MAPQQHLVISWVLSNLNYEKKRDRIVATLCGIFPDIDGLGLLIDKITGDQGYSYYFLWHRKFGHSLFILPAVIIIAFVVCKRKIRPAVVAAMAFIVHLLLDLAGSAGPDGSIWPIYPFWPFSDYEASVSWQWPLNDWKNIAITAVFIFIMIAIAIKRRRSLLEIFSTRLDLHCISVFERIFGKRQEP